MECVRIYVVIVCLSGRLYTQLLWMGFFICDINRANIINSFKMMKMCVLLIPILFCIAYSSYPGVCEIVLGDT